MPYSERAMKKTKIIIRIISTEKITTGDKGYKGEIYDVQIIRGYN